MGVSRLDTPLGSSGLRFARGKEEVRLFALRPQHDAAMPAGCYRAALQPVVGGQVQAWAPLWQEWLPLDEINARAASLEAQGWTLKGRRPEPKGGPHGPC